jgi:hypothetical protein
MKKIELNNSPIQGKTFSLFGNTDSTGEYYRIIRLLADKILENNRDINSVLEIIDSFSSKKKYLRKLIEKPVPGLLISDWMNLIHPELKQFTQKTEEHLKNLSVFKLWDRRLATTREQYHLYMLEIELTNRLFIEKFKRSDKKIALLPYCLRDLSVDCQKVKKGFDYQCMYCSEICFQRQISIILRKNNIEPYIWTGRNMKHFAKATLKSGKSFAVLGIACVPELFFGIQKCRKYKIPVVGIPLNANRCLRWFGEFFPNSINIDELEKLVSVGNGVNITQ